jgi:hypothetical protein
MLAPAQQGFRLPRRAPREGSSQPRCCADLTDDCQRRGASRCTGGGAIADDLAEACPSGIEGTPVKLIIVYAADVARRRSVLLVNAGQSIATSRQCDPASPPLCPARHPPQSVAACLLRASRRILSRTGTKSCETIYGGSVRAAAEVIAVRSRL